MRKQAESDPELREKYERMMEQGEHQYPYVLFLDDEAFIPGVYVDYQYWAEMDETVQLIRNAGGVAIVAHYHSIERKVTPDLLEQFFQEDRLDGIETVFGLWGYGTAAEEDIERTRTIARELAEKYNKLKSGGADIHKAEDFSDFARADWYASETIGMAERIIEEAEIDTRWLSL